MRNPVVKVTMPPDFHSALLAFAESVNRTPQNLMIHATATYMSKEHAWRKRGRLTKPEDV